MDNTTGGNGFEQPTRGSLVMGCVLKEILVGHQRWTTSLFEAKEHLRLAIQCLQEFHSFGWPKAEVILGGRGGVTSGAAVLSRSPTSTCGSCDPSI